MHRTKAKHVHRYDLSSEVRPAPAINNFCCKSQSIPRIEHHRAVTPLPTSSPLPPLFDILIARLCARHNTPRADLVVGVTSEQRLAVVRPRERDALRLARFLADLHVLGLKLVDLALLLEVEDDDRGRGGGAQPVAVGREDEGVDLVAGGERVQVLGLVQVPQHGGAVLAAGCTERAVGRDGDGVDVAGVADVVGLDAAGGELPDLYYAVSRISDKRCEDEVRRIRTDQCAGEGKNVSHGPQALK